MWETKKSQMTEIREQYADTIVIDAQSSREPIDKNGLLRLLRAHGVNIAPVTDPQVAIGDVIPILQKAKVSLPESFYKDLALRLNMVFLDYAEVTKIYKEEQRSKLISVLPYPIVSKYKAIPLSVNDSVMDLAVDNPLDKRVLVAVKYLFGTWNINLHVVSSKSIDWAIDNIYREIHKKNAILDLYNRTPDQSAYRVLYPKQKKFILATIAAFADSMIINSTITLIVAFAFISVGYFIVNPIKIYISILGFRGSRKPTVISNDEIQSNSDDLPVYTVLIPVFHEAEVLAQNMRNMYRLNYPRSKLDIKILMEEKDEETINEARLLGLFGSPKKMVDGIPDEEYTEFLKLFDPIIVPAAKDAAPW